jgi:phosphatidylserine decarboxylase
LACSSRSALSVPASLTVPSTGETMARASASTGRVPGLFARNERVVCSFETALGPFVLVLVGATIVGSMATVWHGVVNPPRPGRVRHWRYDDGAVQLQQGDEMGRFQLGSTVVMLWPPGPLRFNPAWAPAGTVRMGEAMAWRR